MLLPSRNISLDVVSKLPAGRLRCLTGLRFFFSLKRQDRTGCGVRPACYSMNTRGSVLGGKAAREFAVDYSFPFSAEVKNEGIFIPTAPYALILWTGTTLNFL